MPLTMEQKKQIVAEVSEVAKEALSAVAVEYCGLSVGGMTELRGRAREGGVYLRVVKNTLARRAVEGTEFECMAEALRGQLALAFSREDPGSAARLVRDFGKENELLKAHALALGGELLDGSQLDRLANLPTGEQGLSMLMAVIKAPIEKFVRTLAEPHAKLVRTVAAVRDQKESAS